ncbi:hypothetical protein [Streptomyces sp. NPDC015130]|uniref:hypothetical protein n=1 Tax=Streptomyces sp. NPDC015130 TaxID=3364940 RepID=UPI0036FA4CA4
MTEHRWTANTVQEALNILDAARKLIEARMLTLSPGDPADRWKAQATAPINLDITIAEGALVQQVNDQHVFLRQVRGEH